MRRSPLPIVLLVFFVTNCGLEYSSHTYRAVGGAKAKAGAPALNMAATQTRKRVGAPSAELRIGAPYRISVNVPVAEGSTKPFKVKSLVYEHDGKTVVAHKPSVTALESKLRNPKAKKKTMVVWVPLDGLKWVEGSKLAVKAEILLPGTTGVTVIEQKFEATKKQRSYSACEHYSML